MIQEIVMYCGLYLLFYDRVLACIYIGPLSIVLLTQGTLEFLIQRLVRPNKSNIATVIFK